MNFKQNMWMYFNIEFTLLCLIITILLLYLLNNYFKYTDEDIIYMCMFWSIFMLYLSFTVPATDNGFIFILDNFNISNNLILIVKKCIIICSFFFLILLNNFKNIIKLNIFEYLLIIYTCILALFIIISSNHLFVIFLFIELVNLCVYCLIGLNNNSNSGIEAAYKYFIQSSFATIIGFFGASFIYFSTGTLLLSEISVLVSFNDINWLTILGVFLIFSSIFFKLGLFPLHSWMPDVYQGSLLITVAFIAIIPKIVYVILFLKLFSVFFNIISSYCIILSLISILYGVLLALYQYSLKRLIAYGSMVHIGLIIFSISIFTPQAITAGLFYLLLYIILMFFIFCFMFFLFEENDNGLFYIDNINKLIIFVNSNKVLLWSLIFILFTLSGLPFFIGFISKWYVFISFIGNGKYLVLFILLSISCISTIYYVRLIRFLIFIDKKNKTINMNNFDIFEIFGIFKKFDKMFIILFFLLLFLNIIIILLHSIIYLYIFKNVIILFL